MLTTDLTNPTDGTSSTTTNTAGAVPTEFQLESTTGALSSTDGDPANNAGPTPTTTNPPQPNVAELVQTYNSLRGQLIQAVSTNLADISSIESDLSKWKSQAGGLLPSQNSAIQMIESGNAQHIIIGGTQYSLGNNVGGGLNHIKGFVTSVNALVNGQNGQPGMYAQATLNTNVTILQSGISYFQNMLTQLTQDTNAPIFPTNFPSIRYRLTRLKAIRDALKTANGGMVGNDQISWPPPTQMQP